jgi:hypothetical protein
MNKAGRRKVLVLIMAYRESLSELETVSLQQCVNLLKEFPIRIVKPDSTDLKSWPIDLKEISFENFPAAYFKDTGTYSRLLLSKKFYSRFTDFEYILIYQLDAFVFKADLEDWCNKGFDYIGAPWFENFTPNEMEGEFIGVGNGGFSLRKVDSHLRVLNTFSFVRKSKDNWKSRFDKKSEGNNNRLRNFLGWVLDHTIRNNTHWLLNNFPGHEDMFWGLFVAKNLEWFKVPSYEEAAAFAFEMQPHRLFRLNHNQLPFGCHAWWKYDLEFWRPHIEKFKYKLKIEKA